MTTESEFRASIVTRLNTVTSIGRVYDYQRYTNDWKQAVDIFGYTLGGAVVLRVWFVSCEAVLPEGKLATGDFGTGAQTIYRYKVRGYMGVSDASESEKAALALAIAAQSALNNSALLAGTDAYSATLARLDPFAFIPWGGVLCHYAELTQEFYVL